MTPPILFIILCITIILLMGFIIYYSNTRFTVTKNKVGYIINDGDIKIFPESQKSYIKKMGEYVYYFNLEPSTLTPYSPFICKTKDDINVAITPEISFNYDNSELKNIIMYVGDLSYDIKTIAREIFLSEIRKYYYDDIISLETKYNIMAKIQNMLQDRCIKQNIFVNDVKFDFVTIKLENN